MSGLIEFVAGDIPADIGQNDNRVNKETEAKIAMTIAKTCMSDNFRFGPGYIMAYDGVVYRQMTEESMKSIVTEAMEYKRVGPVYVINSVKPILKYTEIKLLNKSFKPRKSLVAFLNMVLDLDTGIAHDPSSALETTTLLPFNYDPKAECPLFKRFLGEVLPDIDTLETLQEFCGALFVDRRDYKIENILFLVGLGQNGKSVMTETLQAMLGGDNYTTFEVEDLVKNSEYNLATMNGKLANICSDMGKSDISGGKYKSLVSGENRMARFPYGRPFPATELPLIIVNVNDMPISTDHTFGNTRRPIPIPFNVRISEEKKDVELGTKLRRELPGIFNWVLEGRNKLLANNCKFKESLIIRNEKERIRVESNSVLQFLAYSEFSSKDSDGAVLDWISNADFYKQYQDFCKEYGKKNFFESVNVGKILAAEGFEARKRGNARGYYLYKGGAQWAPTTEDTLQEMLKEADLPDDLPF